MKSSTAIGLVSGLILGTVIGKAVVDEREKEIRNEVKCFISLPMNGKNENDILINIEKAQHDAEVLIKAINPYVNIKFIDGYNTSSNNAVYLLGQSIVKMSDCDYVFFCKDWEKYRGCVIEHTIATKYDKTILYQNN
jgi:hypothetical protein